MYSRSLRPCLFIGIVGCLSSASIHAQTFYIKGKVKSAKGETIPGATVIVKGTKISTATGVDGLFSLKVTTVPLRLEFLSVGYETAEKKISTKDFKDSVASIVVQMKESVSYLEEVVVTAYNAIGESADHSYSPAVAGSLEGKLAGVEVRAGTAAVKIRGAAALSKEESAYTSGLKFTDRKYDAMPVTEKRTSLLTAGEVNDFKKWNMWEDYNETDFKTHSNKWELYATQRYSVQLQNENYNAVVGETVYLVNKETKEVLWTAVTDNTGKAELWNGFAKANAGKNVVIKIRNEEREFPATPFSQGINHVRLKRNCAVSNKVEVAFVVDATGSMADEIEYLKEELGDILAKFSLKEPSLDLHTGAVFYRDKGDAYVTSVHPLTNNAGSTMKFIREQSAAGGGDYPEALKEALEDATGKLEWSVDARAKIIFLLMDAPPHDEAKNEMGVLIAKAAAKGIRIVPVACSGTDKATEFIMRSMALATNGTYLFLTDDSGIGNPHIKPTTDEFKVELLNDLLLRVMEQMCFANGCNETKKMDEPLAVFSNTEAVKVFPNPSQGRVTLETDKLLSEIFVTDFTGKLLMRIGVKDSSKQYGIDLSHFPSATYFIRYITKENTAGAEKVVLIH